MRSKLPKTGFSSHRRVAAIAAYLLALVTSLGACGVSASGPEAPDAGAGTTMTFDAGPPDTPGSAAIVLSETVDSVVTPGDSVVCYATGAQSTRDGSWYRVFRMTDFGIAGDFQVTSVSFAVDHARNARGVRVAVGTYAGPLGEDLLRISGIAILATAAVDVPDGEQAQRISVPIAAQIPARQAIVVQVTAPDLANAGHFNLGATASAQTAPGYFSSTSCPFPSPTDTATLGGAGHLVIEVSGVPAAP